MRTRLTKTLSAPGIESQKSLESVICSLVTYLDANQSALKEIKKGNLQRSKWILKSTARELIALEISTGYIDMLSETNGPDILDQIRKEAYSKNPSF
jgi:hypothetical protein